MMRATVWWTALLELALVSPGLAEVGEVPMVRLDTPFVYQEKGGCGSAAIAMVILYWKQHGAAIENRSADPDLIFRTLHEPGRNGISGERMARYLKELSFAAIPITAELADVQEDLAAGRPVLVCIRPTKQAPLHYLLIVGSDRRNRTLIVHDPARGAYIAMKDVDFIPFWKRAGNWALIVSPRSLP